MTLKFYVWPWQKTGHLFYATSSFFNHYSPNMPNLGQNQQYFVMCDFEIWQMTLKNNRTHFPCYLKLCASFHIHQWIQAWVTVWKCSIRVKISNFLSCVTLKFNRWPCKTIGYLSYTMSTFVDHSVAIFKLKLELLCKHNIGQFFYLILQWLYYSVSTKK